MNIGDFNIPYTERLTARHFSLSIALGHNSLSLTVSYNDPINENTNHRSTFLF